MALVCVFAIERDADTGCLGDMHVDTSEKNVTHAQGIPAALRQAWNV